MNNDTMLLVNQKLNEMNKDPKTAIAVRYVSEKGKQTCYECAAFDGRVFKIPEQENEIPKLPMHPNCKCRQIPIYTQEEYKRLTQVGSVTVRVDQSNGIGGIRISGIDDMLDKLEKEYPNGGIQKLIISNHGNNPGSFPMGNDDDLRHIVRNPRQLERLKKLLTTDAVLDIRMCHTAEGAMGAESAQKLADALGVKIIGYEGPVSPYGTRPSYVKPDDVHGLSYFQRFFPDPKPKVFIPQKDKRN